MYNVHTVLVEFQTPLKQFLIMVCHAVQENQQIMVSMCGDYFGAESSQASTKDRATFSTVE